ncbi:MAG: hypothetical protein LBK73_14265 [Treponema sp.]|nr:hypothetical protein [Treponema sp.]
MESRPVQHLPRLPRAVDETISVIRDPIYSGFSYEQLLGGFDNNARGHMAWSMSVDGAAQNPARCIKQVVPAWQAIVEDDKARY